MPATPQNPERDAAVAELDEMVGEFLLESHEGLDRMDQDLLVLERDPGSPEAIARIFRTMHTIKGTCGFLGFNTTEALAHAAESLLGGLRDGDFAVTPEIVTALLSAGDAVRGILAEIQSTGSEGAQKHAEVIATLGRLGATKRQTAVRVRAAVRRTSTGASPAAKRRRTPARARRPKPAGEPAPKKGAAPRDETPAETHTVGDAPIRVDVGLLDGLMTLVGELVLARNQILQRTTVQQDRVLSNTAQRLDAITTELQEGIMRTRMQPIGTLWVKYPRLARDLALECGKQVRIRTEGEHTELDRSLIEAVRDPLIHLVRNSIDHGIEPAADRKKTGKPQDGTVLIRAFHEGGQVVVEVADDGSGIDPARLRAKAVESGHISIEAAEQMSDREALNLIFLPGFSTAEHVTKVSGRGVGMDVVRTNVERVGGNIDMQSRPGEGTTFKIKIPLTLAIIPALLVTAAGERYAIPQVSLLELVRIEAEDVARAIETIQGAPVYRLRGRLLPLVSLAAELGEAGAQERARRAAQTEIRGADEAAGPDATFEDSPAKDWHDHDDGAVNIVVLQADDRRFGLLVDRISDSAEIVVKPLGRDLKGIGVFAGATIMGDGRVGLILDVMGLAHRAHVVDQIHDRAPIEELIRGDAAKENTTALLLFSDATGGRMALALDLVDRLEEFPTSLVERSGPETVIQYRDEILPLVDVSGLLPESRRTPRSGSERLRTDSGVPIDQETIQVLVHRRNGRLIGVVVERIIDIVEATMDLQPAGRPGVAGTLVIHERVTEVLDLPTLLAKRDQGQEVAGAWA
jgi:two-component system, chemotaxis family, sensor kinase CheA